jgi:transcriptional regulator with XRE-family HTH domain
MTDFFDLKQPEVTSGRLLLAFRKNFGFTLKDVELLTGIQQSNLSAMENNRKPVGYKAAEKLGAIYGIMPELILFPNDTSKLDTPKLRKIHRESLKLQERKLALG